MAIRERIRVEDLFPGARALFPARGGLPLPALALALTGAVLLLLLGGCLLRWADRNL